MSARLLGLAFDAEAPSASAKLVLIKLVDCCDDEGRKIFPAVATLARAAQCDARTVQRHLALFCVVGLLRRVREGGSGRGSTSHYEMNLDVLKAIVAKGWAAVAGQRAEPAEEPEASDIDAESHAENAGQGEGGEGARNSKGDMVSPYPGALRTTNPALKGDTSATQPLKRIPQTRERERGGADAGEGAGLSHAAHAGGEGPSEGDGDVPRLEDFVKAWPTSAVDSQARMQAAWGVLSLPDRREALRRVPDYLAELKRQKRGHVPAGFNYLSERKWLLLPEMRAVNEGDTAESVKPYSKIWWALFHAARLGPGGKARLLLNWAEQGRAWFCRGSEIEAAMPDRVKAFPAHGAVATAFLAEARSAGFHFPRFAETAWIFLPENRAEAAASLDTLSHGDLR